MENYHMLSIIVPCYNEEASVPLFYQAVVEMKEKIDEEVQFLFINDGSHDGTLKILKALASQDDSVKYLSFSRNFGKEAAIYAGLQHAQGEYVVIMDADLQDPPSLLPDMLHAVKEEGYDSVATRRVSRKGEPPIRSFFARLFYKIMNSMSDVDLVDGARDYRLMTRKFVNALLSLEEKCRFSKGLFGWVGFQTKWLEYENVERIAGETKWSFWSLFLYAIDGIVAFSTVPLIASAYLGCIMSGVSFLFLMYVFIKKAIWGNPVAGWASMICVMVFIGGLLMFAVGILGQYLAKLYSEIKSRPIYICEESNLKQEYEKFKK